MTGTATGIAVERVRAWFSPKRSGPAPTARQRAAMKFYATAADARSRAAAGDAAPEMIPVSVGLLRDAVRCFLRALDHARKPDAELATEGGDGDALELLDAPGLLPTSEERVVLVRRALGATDAVAFETWSAADLASVRESLELLVAKLRARVDLRTDAHFRALGLARVAIVGLLVVYGVVCLAGSLLGGKNIARGKPVTMSSRHPGTPDPSGLVDGVVGGSYGAHTQVSGPQPPWITVDLQKAHKLRRIVVFNRGDQNLDQCLPFAVSVSDDGQTYREVAKRETHFGSGDVLSAPWKIDVKQTARYVRVTAHDYVALSELEVYE